MDPFKSSQRAVFWFCVGFVLALFFGLVLLARAPQPEVTMLEPRIEHATTAYTVYRLRLEWRGAEKSCELTVFHDRQTWRLTCDPR